MHRSHERGRSGDGPQDPADPEQERRGALGLVRLRHLHQRGQPEVQSPPHCDVTPRRRPRPGQRGGGGGGRGRGVRHGLSNDVHAPPGGPQTSRRPLGREERRLCRWRAGRGGTKRGGRGSNPGPLRQQVLEAQPLLRPQPPP